jgi:hypothetical protein
MTQLFAGGGLSSLDNTNLAQKLVELQLTINYMRAFYRTDEHFFNNALGGADKILDYFGGSPCTHTKNAFGR